MINFIYLIIYLFSYSFVFPRHFETFSVLVLAFTQTALSWAAHGMAVDVQDRKIVYCWHVNGNGIKWHVHLISMSNWWEKLLKTFLNDSLYGEDARNYAHFFQNFITGVEIGLHFPPKLHAFPFLRLSCKHETDSRRNTDSYSRFLGHALWDTLYSLNVDRLKGKLN